MWEKNLFWELSRASVAKVITACMHVCVQTDTLWGSDPTLCTSHQDVKWKQAVETRCEKY